MHQTEQESETETLDDARTMRCEPVGNARKLFELCEGVVPCVMSTCIDTDTAARREHLSNTIRVVTSKEAWRG
jgi:hypothetical protein